MAKLQIKSSYGVISNHAKCRKLLDSKQSFKQCSTKIEEEKKVLKTKSNEKEKRLCTSVQS